MGEIPPATLFPTGDTHSGTLCPSYLMCPSPGASGQTCLCLCLQGRSLLGLRQRRSKQGGGCRGRSLPGAPLEPLGHLQDKGCVTVQLGEVASRGQAWEAMPLRTEER